MAESLSASAGNSSLSSVVTATKADEETLRSELLVATVMRLQQLAKQEEPPKITEQEAAAAAIEIYTQKGEKALESLLTRALQPNGKLVGYERKIVQKHMIHHGDMMAGIDRRKFMYGLGTAGATIALGAMALTDAAKLAPAAVDDAMENLAPDFAASLKKSKADARRGRVKELADHVAKHHPTDQTTIGDAEKFYEDVEQKIRVLGSDGLPADPVARNPVSRVIPYIASAVGLHFSIKGFKTARREKEAILNKAAEFLAHKVTSLMEEEKKQFLAQDGVPSL